jgi:uncharacterized membrane protein YkoI
MRKSLFLLILLAGTAWAAETHETARQAVERGELLPLSTILARVEKEFPGRVVEVELERRGKRFVYEIEVLQDGGRVVEVKYDGRTGEQLSVELEDDD